MKDFYVEYIMINNHILKYSQKKIALSLFTIEILNAFPLKCIK